MTVLSSRDGISRRPNFDRLGILFPKLKSLQTFFGITGDLVEWIGEEKRTIGIFLQMYINYALLLGEVHEYINKNQLHI